MRHTTNKEDKKEEIQIKISAHISEAMEKWHFQTCDFAIDTVPLLSLVFSSLKAFKKPLNMYLMLYKYTINSYFLLSL